MCPKSFGGVRFDLGALLEGRMWLSLCHASTMSRPGIHCVETQCLVFICPNCQLTFTFVLSCISVLSRRIPGVVFPNEVTALVPTTLAAGTASHEDQDSDTGMALHHPTLMRKRVNYRIMKPMLLLKSLTSSYLKNRPTGRWSEALDCSWDGIRPGV